MARSIKLNNNDYWDRSSIYEGKVVWSNPNPTNEFAGQTIQVDTSEFDYIIIEFKWYKNSTGRLYQRLANVSSDASLFAMQVDSTNNLNEIISRKVTKTLTSITINDCNYYNGTYHVDNNRLVPTGIRAYKKDTIS